MIKKIKIAPSLLSADFANLERDVNLCLDGGADIMHFDIMDGHFVPNITFGPLIVAAIKPKLMIPADVHLMITDPDRYIPAFAKAGADMISVHVETCNHLHRTVSFIKSFDIKAGIVLNPVTPLEYAYNAAEYCDFILLMSVNPGFGGQEFINSYCRKSYHLRKFLDKEGLDHVEIEVDGGIKADNIHLAIENGSNIIVSGSGVFLGNIKDNIKKMKENASRVLSV
jgi:ribulose-phosphate 3-epimerase